MVLIDFISILIVFFSQILKEYWLLVADEVSLSLATSSG